MAEKQSGFGCDNSGATNIDGVLVIAWNLHGFGIHTVVKQAQVDPLQVKRLARQRETGSAAKPARSLI